MFIYCMYLNGSIRFKIYLRIVMLMVKWNCIDHCHGICFIWIHQCSGIFIVKSRCHMIIMNIHYFVKIINLIYSFYYQNLLYSLYYYYLYYFYVILKAFLIYFKFFKYFKYSYFIYFYSNLFISLLNNQKIQNYQ
jgi:hypothetical protein